MIPSYFYSGDIDLLCSQDLLFLLDAGARVRIGKDDFVVTARLFHTDKEGGSVDYTVESAE